MTTKSEAIDQLRDRSIRERADATVALSRATADKQTADRVYLTAEWVHTRFLDVKPLYCYDGTAFAGTIMAIELDCGFEGLYELEQLEAALLTEIGQLRLGPDADTPKGRRFIYAAQLALADPMRHRQAESAANGNLAPAQFEDLVETAKTKLDQLCAQAATGALASVAAGANREQRRHRAQTVNLDDLRADLEIMMGIYQFTDEFPEDKSDDIRGLWFYYQHVNSIISGSYMGRHPHFEVLPQWWRLLLLRITEQNAAGHCLELD